MTGTGADPGGVSAMLTDLELMERAVAAAPGDAVVRGALVDLLMDGGATRRAALRRVSEVESAAAVARAAALVSGPGRAAAAARTACRRAAGLALTTAAPVVVVAGAAAPAADGEPGYYEFRNGGRCMFPGAARRYGYRTAYRRSTERVVVGAEWVLANVPVGKKKKKKGRGK